MSQIAIVHFVNYKKGTQSRAAMRGVMLYVMQTKKAEWEGERLISGINCQPESVCDDFLNTKLLYHKDKGVMFYHMVQSFPKGAEINLRMAHEAARRLAEYFEGYEVLVCTHIDRDHIHSHCIINSVNFETGKKLHMAKEQIQELMRHNDIICKEMGLPVFEAPTQKARGMSGSEYHTAFKGESWKLRLANTIDECMKYASDREEFISLMESEGYAVRWEQNRKSITYTTPDGMKCRDNKLHEEKYLKEVMEHEFRIRAELDAQRTTEILARVEADEPTEYNTGPHVHHAPVPDGGRSAGADAAGERCLLGAANATGVSSKPEIPHRSDGGADLADRNAKLIGANDFSAGTGWEAERKAYLQMFELAAGLRPLACGQVDRAGAGPGHSGAGNGVRNRNGRQQYSKSLSLMPLQAGVSSLAAAGILLDDEDDEERYRRIQAEQEAKNIGAVLGLAAGAAIALTNKPEEEVQQQQQTMGGL